jgi:ABC-2 type transport system permease protein
MRTVWHIARHDVMRWLRSPALIAATLIPAAGMALMVLGLTYAVGRQPVALVVQSEGTAATKIAQLISTSDGFFLVKRTPEAARKDLQAQKVAGVITIPPSFDADVKAGTAKVDVLINNVDLDFSDDIRRSVSEAVVSYNVDAGRALDASEIAESGGKASDIRPEDRSVILGSHFRTNPYGVSVDEFDVRHPDTSFLAYQLVPVLALLALTGGTLVTALGLTGERELGTLRLVQISPARAVNVALGHLLGGAAGAAALITAVVVPATALGVLHPPVGRWLFIVGLLLLTAVAATALGVVIGVLCRRTTTAVLVGVNAVAASFLLGGGFTTVAFLPDVVQNASRLTPTYYSVSALREAFFYDHMTAAAHDLVVLALFAAGAVALAAAFLARAERRPLTAGVTPRLVKAKPPSAAISPS